MAVSISINDLSIPPMIDVDVFKSRVTEYAVALLQQMTKSMQAEDSQAFVKHHTSPRIDRLRLKGGQLVEANIDELEAIYLEKYA